MGKVEQVSNQAPTGFVLFMAYVGAAVYFVNQSSGFFGFFWALIKAIAWPAILIYQGMQAFGV